MHGDEQIGVAWEWGGSNYAYTENDPDGATVYPGQNVSPKAQSSSLTFFKSLLAERGLSLKDE